MHQIGKFLGAPAIAHMKMKTAPVMMLDEMTIGGVGALMRFEHRRGMDTAVKAADFVGGFTQIFGNKFIKARKRFGLFTAFKFLNVAFFNEYASPAA